MFVVPKPQRGWSLSARFLIFACICVSKPLGWSGTRSSLLAFLPPFNPLQSFCMQIPRGLRSLPLSAPHDPIVVLNRSTQVMPGLAGVGLEDLSFSRLSLLNRAPTVRGMVPNHPVHVRIIAVDARVLGVDGSVALQDVSRGKGVRYQALRHGIARSTRDCVRRQGRLLLGFKLEPALSALVFVQWDNSLRWSKNPTQSIHIETSPNHLECPGPPYEKRVLNTLDAKSR